MFLPYKADLVFNRIPFLTIIISIACLLIYNQQVDNEAKLVEETEAYCLKTTRSFDKALSAVHLTCPQFLLKIRLSETDYQDDIKDYVFENKAGKRTLGGDEYLTSVLTERYEQYLVQSPDDYLTDKLKYKPESWNLTNMVTSAFAHGSWSHVIGNVFFFLAFSATVEIILGTFWYIYAFLLIAIGSNISYSLYTLTEATPAATLGLSGVVMGMMGLFVYFLPKTNIHVIFFIIVFFKRLLIPAWILVGTYFALDLYTLFQSGMSGVNLVAHISGAAIGFLIGWTLFKGKKQALKEG